MPPGDGRHHLILGDGRRVVVKRRAGAPPGFFAAEARGLALLAVPGALRVPQVFAVQRDAIVLEDLGRGHPARSDWERAGRALALVHARRAGHFGLDADGWCGDSPQLNTPMDDGWRFFAECRLLPQGRRAAAAGLLQEHDLAAIERLCLRLPDSIPVMPPVTVHGDLWLANVHPCGSGELALIDAGAAHLGWAEADLAMLTLFGEPPAVFFTAYEEASGVDKRWRSRAALYNLYHLLNHLNLFGSGYLGAVREVIARY